MMTTSKTRGSTRKMGPISIGSKVVRFKIPSFARHFTVHEDLICRSSALFKREIQKNRRLIDYTNNAEDCCVCQEDLDPITKDITYCATCGQNIHDTCIEQWKQISSNKPGTDRTTPTCPMCRAEWKNAPLLKSVNLNEDVDAKAVQMYLDWLYSGILRIPATISRTKDTFNLALLKCWAVASAVDDESFKNVVVSTFFDEAKAQFWIDSVKWAFVDGGANDEIKTFIIEVYMAHMDKGWFQKEGGNWPMEFVMVLADNALDGTKRKSYDSVQKEWMKKLEIKDEDIEVQEEDSTAKVVPTETYRTVKANKFFGSSATPSMTSSAKSRKNSVTNAGMSEPSEWQLLTRCNSLRSRVEVLVRK